ncbi:hypothetical protein M5689_024469 [Euphorbia peplus]|nr:hypothetical protein M5689_024469 [Euphorbia peplus]
MERWGANFKTRFTGKIAGCKRILSKLVDKTDDVSVKRFIEAKRDLNHWLEVEEAYWKQRAKAFWLLGGDQNSKFFHACVQSRKKANKMVRLRDRNGALHEDETEMGYIVKDYFTELFLPSIVDSYDVVNVVPRVLTEADNAMLIASFDPGEF